MRPVCDFAHIRATSRRPVDAKVQLLADSGNDQPAVKPPLGETIWLDSTACRQEDGDCIERPCRQDGCGFAANVEALAVFALARRRSSAGIRPRATTAAIAHHAWRKAASRSSGDPGMPMMATKAATPTAIPVWRIMLMTPDPVAKEEAGRAPVAVPIIVGKASPVPAPISVMPPITVA